MPVKKILFVFNHSREQRLREYQSGQGPDEFLYGLNHFNPDRFIVSSVERDLSQRPWHWWLWYPFEWLITRTSGLGFSLPLALDSLKKIRAADALVITADAVGLPIVALKWAGLLTTPVIYISQGLTDRITATSPSWRRFFRAIYGRLLRQAERVLVFGEGAVEPIKTLFRLDPAKVGSIPFGVDEKFWQAATLPQTDNYILSIGSDQGRDYKTLCVALPPGQNLKIVTRQHLPAEWLKPEIAVASNFSNQELRQLYQQALFVVIPLYDITQPSGQSATLQAMACGKAVILTKTRGLWEGSSMLHQENCYLVPPGDVASLRQAINYAQAHPQEVAQVGQAARRTIEQRFTSRHLAEQLERCLEQIW